MSIVRMPEGSGAARARISTRSNPRFPPLNTPPITIPMRNQDMLPRRLILSPTSSMSRPPTHRQFPSLTPRFRSPATPPTTPTTYRPRKQAAQPTCAIPTLKNNCLISVLTVTVRSAPNAPSMVLTVSTKSRQLERP